MVAVQGGAQVRVNGQPWTRYDDVIPGGDPIQLGADELQILAGGKTQTRFLAWSNGGPREQTVISNPERPDTLTATFTTQHRILLTRTGSGSVLSERRRGPDPRSVLR